MCSLKKLYLQKHQRKHTKMSHLKRNIDYLATTNISIFDELSLWSSYFTKLILDNIEMRPNLNVLDVGYGLGVPILELAQRFGTRETFTEGRNEMEWLRHIYDTFRGQPKLKNEGVPDFDTFWEDGYVETPMPSRPYNVFETCRADPVANCHQ